jgi:DNA (cytosine-5)-methyltransferase 1
MIIDDIRNIDFKNLMEENNIKEGDIDVIAGGPPCQGFSMANRKKIEEDQRNLLFLEFVRAVKTFRPKCFLIENVMGMTAEKIAIKNTSSKSCRI